MVNGFSRKLVATLTILLLAQGVCASSGFECEGGSQRTNAGRIAEGVGGAAFVYAGYGIASSGWAGIAGAIGSASTALANGGVATGLLGAVGGGAGLVALGGAVLFAGVHYLTDATGLWTFDDSRKLLKKFGKKIKHWFSGKQHENTCGTDARLVWKDELPEVEPLPPLDDWIGKSSRKDKTKTDAGPETEEKGLVSSSAVQAVSDSTADLGSLRDRIAKRRKERRELRSLDFDDDGREWCECEEPGCSVEENRHDGKIGAMVVFGCTKCGKTNREYARLAVKWEKKMLRQGLDVQWVGANAEANARKAAGDGK